MTSIKFYKKNAKPLAKIENTVYRGFTVGDMPSRFAFIYDKDNDKDGIRDWFNCKGLTYINVLYFPEF